MAKLTTYVSLFDDVGTLHTFGPSIEVPGWARARITNPSVWDSQPEPVEPVQVAPPASPTVPVTPVIPPQGDDIPPQNGPGATRQVWADYAEKHGVKIQADWKREAIIDAVEAAGVPVE
ncbi:hypothetical protein KXR83_05760 [Williamsia muralis]|uniref:hypothetical protein n=1 Tax=Williamsia marianensis TaxID=85044 RepID=UPI003F173861